MLLGAAAGAAAAILYAPQSGTETRDLLKTKAGEAKEKASTAVESARTKAREVASNVSSGSHQIAEKVRTKVEAQVAAVQAGLDAGKQAYQEKSTHLTNEVQQDVAAALGTERSADTQPA
jgi:gas vesicle protein